MFAGISLERLLLGFMVTSVCASRETYVVVKMRFLPFLHICSGLEARSMRCLFCVVSTRVVNPDDPKTRKVLDELLSVYCDHSEGHDCLSMCTTCKTCMLKAPVSCMTLSCPLADHGHHFSGKLHAQHTGGLLCSQSVPPWNCQWQQLMRARSTSGWLDHWS